MTGHRLFTKGTLVLIVALICIGSSLPPVAYAKAKRGDDPKCQEECLEEHVRCMKELSNELLSTGHKMVYQDRVGEAASRYLYCLTNCREVLPVK
jgi:hypothetical protein